MALSLHAPNQTLRERIVPVASKAWPLPKLIAVHLNLNMMILQQKMMILQ